MHQLEAVVARWGQALQDHHALLQDLQQQLNAHTTDGSQVWNRLCKEVLLPDQPFELHQQLYAAAYANWHAAERGPAPVWQPDPLGAADTNLARFMAKFQGDLRWEAERTGDPVRDWPLLQRVSCVNPEVFWAAVLKEMGLRFSTPPSRILAENVTQPDKTVWLPGARLNIAACALHTAKAPSPDHPAVIWAAEGAPTQLQAVSRAELRRRSMQVAACVAARFKPGDALAVAMPLTVDAVVIYLGIVLAGCVVVSIADSFAAEEVAVRLRIAGAAAVFTQDVVLRGGKALPLYSRVTGAAGTPPAIVIPAAKAQQPQLQLRQGDSLWEQFLGAAGGGTASFAGLRELPHIVEAAAYSNILFSSGTTGEPKAIPWSHTTPLRCGVDGWALQDIQPGNVVAWPTNLGWMMGPWLLYASLLNGATIALYQGAPLGRDFGEFVAAARVNVLGLVPSIVKAWRSSNCMARLDWSSVKCFSSTGEASSPEDHHWLASRVKGYRPVIEYCGGTEIGGGFLSGCLLQPQAPSTFSTPTLGASLVLLAEDGTQHPHSTTAGPVTGELTLVPPMLGMSQQLINRDHTSTYYTGMPACKATGRPLRKHGDEIARLPGGYYRALGRVDDTMNLGGIKVSSVELERVVLAHVPGVAEAAAVGITSPGGGPEMLHMFIVPTQQLAAHISHSSDKAAAAASEVKKLHAACQAAVRAHLNPLFKVEKVLLVPSLPRTASNKVMRRVLRKQVEQPSAKL